VVTRRLIELMGGEIGVTSLQGLGSTFWVDLQLAIAPSPVVDVRGNVVAHPVPSTESVAPLPALLYVEDNPANLRVMQEFIAQRGDLRLLSAGSAQLGLALARMHRPRVIVLDLNLPDFGGRAVLELLRRDKQLSAIPVIAVTANATAAEVAQGLAAGFFRYITKPVNLAGLTEAVESALRHADGRRGAAGEPGS